MSLPDEETQLAMAREAGAMLQEDSMFNHVTTSLVQKYMEDIIVAEINTPQSFAAHAKLKALNDIKGDLRSIANNGEVILKKHSDKSEKVNPWGRKKRGHSDPT